MYTTLNRIFAEGPCGMYNRPGQPRRGFSKLLDYLSKCCTDDEPLSFTTILDSNGIDDALWCLYTVSEAERVSVALWAVQETQKDHPHPLLNETVRLLQGSRREDDLRALRQTLRPDKSMNDTIKRLALIALSYSSSMAAMDSVLWLVRLQSEEVVRAKLRQFFVDQESHNVDNT